MRREASLPPLSKHIKGYNRAKKLSLYAGLAFFVISTVSYVIHTRFLVLYGYEKLYNNVIPKATELFTFVMVLSALEFIAFTFLIITAVYLIRAYILGNMAFLPKTKIILYRIRTTTNLLLKKQFFFRCSKSLYVLQSSLI